MSKLRIVAGKRVYFSLLALLSIIKSKSEARRLIEQGGIVIDGVKRTDLSEMLEINPSQEIVVKKGKKTFLKVVVVQSL